MKLSILWSSLADYTHAFFVELARRGVKIQLIYHGAVEAEAPYEFFDLSAFAEVHCYAPGMEVAKIVDRWKPDLCLMVSWNRSYYRKACRELRRKGLYVVSATDNQWRGTFRQRLGIIISRYYLHSAIDAVFVPGDRQHAFMRRLGFTRTLLGWYAADARRFRVEVPIRDRRRAFLFVGRLVEIKGIAELLEGYADYRSHSKDPWELHLVGTGPLSAACSGRAGVIQLGFAQPRDLPRLFNEYRCLFLPSHSEPWGVVVHEAALCGLAIVSSPACGAAATFVRPGFNGLIVEAAPDPISAAMMNLEGVDEEVWEKISARSTILGNTWTLENMVSLFLSEFGRQGRTDSSRFG